MSWLWVRVYYVKAKQALQWWQGRQSMRLFIEAEKIRDGLLQDSFVMHRSLERSLEDHVKFSTKDCQDWLTKVDRLYHSLDQLSDCLSPAYIEDSLPLAIQCVVEPWQRDTRVTIEMDLPGTWPHETAERSLVILRILDELLQIILADLATEILIKLSLKAQGSVGELIVGLDYPNLNTLVSHKNLKELQYISQIFRFLTSGHCYNQKKGLTVNWHFQWVMQVDRLPSLK